MEGTSELLAALLGAVVGGGITLWQAKREHRLQRIANAMVAYRDLLDRRGVAAECLSGLYGVRSDGQVVWATASHIAEARERFAEYCGAIESALLHVMVSDSKTLRTNWADALARTYREILQDVEHRNGAGLLRHVEEEKRAAAGVAEGTEFLRSIMAKLPEPGAPALLYWFAPFSWWTRDGGDQWLQVGSPRRARTK